MPATTWNAAQSYLYCAADGNGNFIVRGLRTIGECDNGYCFSLNGRGDSNAAVKKAAGPGEPVTQEIAVTVKRDKRRVRDQRHRGRQLPEGRVVAEAN